MSLSARLCCFAIGSALSLLVIICSYFPVFIYNLSIYNLSGVFLSTNLVSASTAAASSLPVPQRVMRQVSMTQARSAMESAISAFCSTSRMPADKSDTVRRRAPRLYVGSSFLPKR